MYCTIIHVFFVEIVHISCNFHFFPLNEFICNKNHKKIPVFKIQLFIRLLKIGILLLSAFLQYAELSQHHYCKTNHHCYNQ